MKPCMKANLDSHKITHFYLIVHKHTLLCGFLVFGPIVTLRTRYDNPFERTTNEIITDVQALIIIIGVHYTPSKPTSLLMMVDGLAIGPVLTRHLPCWVLILSSRTLGFRWFLRQGQIST
nr:unnamed protein product [Callosobruchus analis]